MVQERDWRELESERHPHGLVSRRLYPRSARNCYLGVEQRTRQRMLLITSSATDAATALQRVGGHLPRTQGLSLSFISTQDGARELRIILTMDELREVFNPLVTDIAEDVQAAQTDVAALTGAVRRFEYWRNLLQTVNENGLSDAARRGLYGELCVLRDHVLPHTSPAEALSSWTGPLMSNQDFQLRRTAIEVKVTSGRSASDIRIASERQLDDTGVSELFLVRLALDERSGGTGESLNDALDHAREVFGRAGLVEQLNDLLARVGMLAHHRNLYDEPRYTVRTQHLWRVEREFPRITERDLRPGVSNCSYHIALAALERFAITPGQLATALEMPRG